MSRAPAIVSRPNPATPAEPRFFLESNGLRRTPRRALPDEMLRVRRHAKHSSFPPTFVLVRAKPHAHRAQQSLALASPCELQYSSKMIRLGNDRQGHVQLRNLHHCRAKSRFTYQFSRTCNTSSRGSLSWETNNQGESTGDRHEVARCAAANTRNTRGTSAHIPDAPLQAGNS